MVQSRNRAMGVGMLALAIGAGVFVLISPAVEREAHIATVTSGDVGDLENALRHLCWIRSGVEELDILIPTLDLHRRRAVLEEVVALGCLDQLKPQVRAAYYLIDADGARNLERAVGYEREAVAPALEALADDDPEFAKRGAAVLAALFRRLTEAETQEAAKLVARLPDGPERRLLEYRLGLASQTEERIDEPSARLVPPIGPVDPKLEPETETLIELQALEEAEQVEQVEPVGPLLEEAAPPSYPAEEPKPEDVTELSHPSEVEKPAAEANPSPVPAAPTPKAEPQSEPPSNGEDQNG